MTRAGGNLFISNKSKLSTSISVPLVANPKLLPGGVARRRRYALLASCGVASLASGLASIPIDAAHAAGAVCGTFLAPNTITQPAQGNPSNLAVNTACGFNAFAGPNVDGTPGNTAVGAYSYADGDS